MARVCFIGCVCVCTVMRPLGAPGCSQLSSSALPCSLCSTVKLARPDGDASKVPILTHGLNTRPEWDGSSRVNEEEHRSNQVNKWNSSILIMT